MLPFDFHSIISYTTLYSCIVGRYQKYNNQRAHYSIVYIIVIILYSLIVENYDDDNNNNSVNVAVVSFIF